MAFCRVFFGQQLMQWSCAASVHIFICAAREEKKKVLPLKSALGIPLHVPFCSLCYKSSGIASGTALNMLAFLPELHVIGGVTCIICNCRKGKLPVAQHSSVAQISAFCSGSSKKASLSGTAPFIKAIYANVHLCPRYYPAELLNCTSSFHFFLVARALSKYVWNCSCFFFFFAHFLPVQTFS